MTVAEALALARDRGLDRLEAQWLLAQLLQRDRAWLISHDADAVSPDVAQQFSHWVSQRLDDVPLAYLAGEKEFHGLRLTVNSATLVPRPDTEVLVDWALELLQTSGLPEPRVLDLGTGSGAIALAIKHRCPPAQVHASDRSAAALAVASSNAQKLGLPVCFHHGSWWEPFEGEQFDLIVSNPPYIAGSDPHLHALRHEPLSALTPGGDGLADLHTLVRGAPAHLQAGAWLLLEHGFDQSAHVLGALQAQGFQDASCRLDLGGQPRCSGARWNP